MDCESSYFHSLKQALFLLHGSTRVFNELSTERQKALWQAVSQSQPELCEDLIQHFRPAQDKAGAIPVRVSIAGLIRQKRIRTSDSSKELMLSDVLTQFGVIREKGATVLVQGVVLSEDLPIYAAWRLLHHADLFLYLIVQ